MGHSSISRAGTVILSGILVSKQDFKHSTIGISAIDLWSSDAQHSADSCDD